MGSVIKIFFLNFNFQKWKSSINVDDMGKRGFHGNDLRIEIIF